MFVGSFNYFFIKLLKNHCLTDAFKFEIIVVKNDWNPWLISLNQKEQKMRDCHKS